MALVRASKRSASTQAPSEQLSPPSLSDLAMRLRSGEPAQRRQAARDLALTSEGIPILCEHLEHEPAVSVRSVIMTSLIQSRSRAVVEGLARYLRSENTALRNEAIEALQDMPEQIAPYMEQALKRP